MIAGDKKALKASVKSGLNNVLRSLVDLYAANLNQLGIQAAVLAGLAFNGAIQSNFPVRHYTQQYLVDCYIFHTMIEIGMILTFLSMTICVISGSYGPSLALVGKSTRVVLYACEEMQKWQEYAFRMAGLSIFFIVFGIVFYSFAQYRLSFACINMFIAIAGSLLLVRRGIRTLHEVRYKGTKYKDEILRALQGIDEAEEQEKLKEGVEKSITYQNYVWRRKEVHDGGSFSYQFAVLEKGALYFYTSEKAYNEHNKPVSRVKLRYMRFSTERADFQVKEMSKAQQEFKFLGGSSTKFQPDPETMFCLVSLENHEIVNAGISSLQMQATSRASFEEWKKHLMKLESYYKEINGNALTAVFEHT